jgi:hypothetical protein
LTTNGSQLKARIFSAAAPREVAMAFKARIARCFKADGRTGPELQAVALIEARGKCHASISITTEGFCAFEIEFMPEELVWCSVLEGEAEGVQEKGL